MGLLVFVFLLAVAFTWLAARSIQAGYGKGLFWLAWFLIGAMGVLSIQIPAPALERFLVQFWAYSLILLPVWWAIAAIRRRHRGAR